MRHIAYTVYSTRTTTNQPIKPLLCPHRTVYIYIIKVYSCRAALHDTREPWIWIRMSCRRFNLLHARLFDERTSRTTRQSTYNNVLYWYYNYQYHNKEQTRALHIRTAPASVLY